MDPKYLRHRANLITLTTNAYKKLKDVPPLVVNRAKRNLRKFAFPPKSISGKPCVLRGGKSDVGCHGAPVGDTDVVKYDTKELWHLLSTIPDDLLEFLVVPKQTCSADATPEGCVVKGHVRKYVFEDAGETLLSLLESYLLTFADVKRIVIKVGQCIATLIKFGYSHSDLHPYNILLDRKGNVKIIDFATMALYEEGKGVGARFSLCELFFPFELYEHPDNYLKAQQEMVAEFFKDQFHAKLDWDQDSLGMLNAQKLRDVYPLGYVIVLFLQNNRIITAEDESIKEWLGGFLNILYALRDYEAVMMYLELG